VYNINRHALRQALLDKKISQNRLSQLARVPGSSISMIVNGKLYPCPVWRKRMSEVLDLPEEILFPESEVK